MLKLDVFLDPTPPFVSQGPQLNPELTYSARLSGQQAPEVSLALGFQACIAMSGFYVGQTQAFVLLRQASAAVIIGNGAFDTVEEIKKDALHPMDF